MHQSSSTSHFKSSPATPWIREQRCDPFSPLANRVDATAVGGHFFGDSLTQSCAHWDSLCLANPRLHFAPYPQTGPSAGGQCIHQNYISIDPRVTVAKNLLTAWSTDEGLAMFSVTRPPLHIFFGSDDDEGCVLAEQTGTLDPVIEVPQGDYCFSPSQTSSASSAEYFTSPTTLPQEPAGQLLPIGGCRDDRPESVAVTAIPNRLQLELRPCEAQNKAHATTCPASSSATTTIIPIAPPETLLGFIQELPALQGRVKCPLCPKQMAPLALHRHLRVGMQHGGKWIVQALNGEPLTERVLASIIIISIGTNFSRRNGVRNRVQLDSRELAAAMAFPHDVSGFSETKRYRLRDHPDMWVFERPLRMMSHRCSTCGKVYARDDIRGRHEKKCGISGRRGSKQAYYSDE